LHPGAKRSLKSIILEKKEKKKKERRKVEKKNLPELVPKKFLLPKIPKRTLVT